MWRAHLHLWNNAKHQQCVKVLKLLPGTHAGHRTQLLLGAAAAAHPLRRCYNHALAYSSPVPFPGVPCADLLYLSDRHHAVCILSCIVSSRVPGTAICAIAKPATVLGTALHVLLPVLSSQHVSFSHTFLLGRHMRCSSPYSVLS